MDKKVTKKLTAAQQVAIDLLSNGWELGISTDHSTATPRTRHWLQHGKVGAGGKSQKIAKATVTSLKELGVIKHVSRPRGRFDAIYELDCDVLAGMGQAVVSEGA